MAFFLAVVNLLSVLFLVRRANLGRFLNRRGPANNHPPKHKQFAQTVCVNSFWVFSAYSKGQGVQFVQTVPKLLAQIVFIWVGGFWVGLAFMIKKAKSGNLNLFLRILPFFP